MLDCKIRLTSKQPEHSTPIPAASKARIEIETTVNQPYGYVDVLTVPSQHKGGWCEYLGVIRSGSKCPSSEIQSRASGGFTVVRPAVNVELRVEERSYGKSRAVTRIAVDR